MREGEGGEAKTLNERGVGGQQWRGGETQAGREKVALQGYL